MRKIVKLLIMILVGVVVNCNAGVLDGLTLKHDTLSFDASQVQQIQKIVHDYLLQNPEILMEVSQKLQMKEMQKEKERIAKIEEQIQPNKKDIFNATSPGRAILGNPNGTVLAVDFLQYQCSHCRATEELLEQLIKANPDLKVIVVLWPFFGPPSEYASLAALAAQKQGKFLEVHKAFFNADQFLSPQLVDKILATIPGLDLAKLRKDMSDKAIIDGLKANVKLSEKINLIGTPTFIFANRDLSKVKLIPGQTRDMADDLAEALKAVR